MGQLLKIKVVKGHLQEYDTAITTLRTLSKRKLIGILRGNSTNTLQAQTARKMKNRNNYLKRKVAKENVNARPYMTRQSLTLHTDQSSRFPYCTDEGSVAKKIQD